MKLQTGLQGLVQALRGLGVRMRVHPQHDTEPQEVSHDALDLMWTEKDEPIAVYIQTSTFRAPAPDAPGEYDEILLERLIVERYRVATDN